jgi:hypothetical protein
MFDITARHSTAHQQPAVRMEQLAPLTAHQRRSRRQHCRCARSARSAVRIHCCTAAAVTCTPAATAPVTPAATASPINTHQARAPRPDGPPGRHKSGSSCGTTGRSWSLQDAHRNMQQDTQEHTLLRCWRGALCVLMNCCSHARCAFAAVPCACVPKGAHAFCAELLPANPTHTHPATPV